MVDRGALSRNCGWDRFSKNEVSMCVVGTEVSMYVFKISGSSLVLGAGGIYSATLGLQPFWFLETGRRVRDNQSLL